MAELHYKIAGQNFRAELQGGILGQIILCFSKNLTNENVSLGSSEAGQDVKGMAEDIDKVSTS